MKILKPDSLAILHRTSYFAGRNRLGLALMGLFSLDPSQPQAVLAESDLWKIAAKAIGEDAVLDEGLPKFNAEFLVFGAAYAASGVPASAVAVTAQLGQLKKSLLVHGDRHFNALGLVSAAQPFTSMPITPENAFGGAGFAANLLGKGRVKTTSPDGVSLQQLPNVEESGRPFLRPGDVTLPAGFWAYGPTAPERVRHLGSFDSQWLKHTWPHLPDNTHTDYFQTAPLDQRISGFFRGDESISLQNLHPSRPVMNSSLPHLRARCFVNRKQAGGDVFMEVETRAETVWLFPDLECGIVLYRAMTPVADEDADDILHVMADWERLSDAPLSFEHYHAEFLKLLPKQGVAAAAEDTFATVPPLFDGMAPAVAVPPMAVAVPAAALVAAGTATSAEAMAASPQLKELHSLAATLDKNNQEVMQQHGITQADLAGFLKPAVEPPAASMEELHVMVNKLQANNREVMAQHKITQQDLLHLMPKEEIDSPASVANLEASVLALQADSKAVMAKHGITQADLNAVLVKSPEAAEILAQPPVDIRAVMAGLAAAMPVAAVLKPQIPPFTLPEAEAEQASPAPKLTREEVVARHALRKGFASMDLSGLDLSALDLSGADFSSALLEKTSFKDSQLAGSVFKDALLAGGDFSGADMRRALLAGASAGGAQFAKAQLNEADASRADFTGADFSQAQISHANVSHALFDGSKMAGLKASSCNAEHTSFTGCDLTGSDLTDAKLTAAMFNNTQLGQATFVHTACENAEFYGADATKANFNQANLKASRADATTRFAGAQLSQSHLGRANWAGVMMAGATLNDAVLDDADFSRAKAADASFAGASAKGSKFDKSDLSRANFTGVNLFKGSLRKANTEATRLQNANLYGVDFYGTTPTIASLEGSNIDQTLLLIRKPGI